MNGNFDLSENRFVYFSPLGEVWLGREDSNLRVPVPKTGALPLGYAPKDLPSKMFSYEDVREKALRAI
jgi:hypothetical protein